MTIDDKSSVYVGGLPYSATEDSVRKVFDFYGSVIAVKIVNDRSARGKSYGFVTFRNPRSATDAINDMNGRTIDGRAVRVSRVTSRGWKSNFGREHFRHNEHDKGRDRERDNDRHSDRYRDRHPDKSQERTPPQDCDKDVGRGYEHAHDHDLSGVHLSDTVQDRDMEYNEQVNSKNDDHELERNGELERSRDMKIDGTNGYHRSVDEDKDNLSRKHNGSAINDPQIRELSSNSSDGYDDQVKELDRSIQRREELRKEISRMEEMAGEKEKLVLDLQKRSKKLEEALISAKRFSSHRHKQLTKLYKCFKQAKEYAERLKRCEQELQSIVDVATSENDMADDAGVKDGVLINGNA